VRADTNRLAYNALLIASSWRAANGIEGVIDFAGQSIIGQSTQSPAKQQR
jgi:UDP-glucose 4-epimerase